MRRFFLKIFTAALFTFALFSCASDDNGMTYPGEPEGPTVYTLRYNMNGGSVGLWGDSSDVVVRSIEPGTLFKDIDTRPEPFSLDFAYAFVAWNPAADGSGEDWTDDTPVTEDTVLYAIYAEDISPDITQMVCDDPSKRYVITNDITLGSNPLPLCYAPEGESAFMGKFYGGGYRISFYNSGARDYSGLFYRLDGAYITNLTVSGAASAITAAGAVAGLAERSVIDGVSVTGSMSAGASDTRLGGIVGILAEGSVIRNSISKATANGGASYLNLSIGGIAGYVSGGSRIENSYHAANLTFTAASNGYRLGGIAGTVDGGSIVSCYTNNRINVTSTLAGFDSSTAGGIAGYLANGSIEKSLALGIMINAGTAGRIIGASGEGASVTDTYAKGGMLLNYATVSNSLKNGTGRSLAEISKSVQFFRDTLNWDLEKIWKMPRHYEYPVLSWETASEFEEISTPEALQAIESAKNYVLVTDIDMSDVTWTTIAAFSGILDGNGKSIVGITRNITSPTAASGSMFTTLSGTVQDIVFVEPEIIPAGTLSASGVIDRVVVKNGNLAGSGGLVGTVNGGTIINSSFDGAIRALAGSSNGGLAGSFANSGGGYILLSSSSGTLARDVGGHPNSLYDTDPRWGSAACSGGIAGRIGADGIIFGSYTTMDVINHTIGNTRYPAGSSAGGLAGCVNGTAVKIRHSYAAGNLDEATTDTIGYDQGVEHVAEVLAVTGGFIGHIYLATTYAATDLTVESSLAFGNSLSIDFANSGGVLTERYGAGRIYGYKTNSSSVAANLDKVYANGAMTFDLRGSPDVFTAVDPGEGVISSTLPPAQNYYAETLGWDFDNVWKMPAADDELGRVYPILKWQ